MQISNFCFPKYPDRSYGRKRSEIEIERHTKHQMKSYDELKTSPYAVKSNGQ